MWVCENRDAILEVDRQIGRLIGWLEGRGWLDETLVVVASDHGMTERPLTIDVTTQLKQAGAGDVVENVLYFMAGSTGGLYLADTSPRTVERTLAAVRSVLHMKGAWHRDDPEAPWFVRRFAYPRSPDILMIAEKPYCIVDEGWQRPSFPAHHGPPCPADASIWMILSGPGVQRLGWVGTALDMGSSELISESEVAHLPEQVDLVPTIRAICQL